MASIYEILEALNDDLMVDGQYALTRMFNIGAAVATNIQPTNLSGIQDASIGEMAPQQSNEVFHQGGGEDSLISERNFRFTGNMKIKAGYLGQVIAGLLGKTWGSTGEYALPSRIPQTPIAAFEAVLRTPDNTHIASVCMQDVIIKPFSWNQPMLNAEATLNFYGRHDWFLLASGAMLCLDKFTADGLTTDFALSGTPLNLVTVTDKGREDWLLDNIVYVKVRSSATAQGARQKSGVTFSTGNITFSSAPANGSIVEVLYAKAAA